MTFTYGVPDPYDPDIYASGGSAEQATAAGARREQLKLLHNPRQRQQQNQQRRHARASPISCRLLCWNPATTAESEASSSRYQEDRRVTYAPAAACSRSVSWKQPSSTVLATHSIKSKPKQKVEEDQATGYVTPSIHTILEIAQSSTIYQVSRQSTSPEDRNRIEKNTSASASPASPTSASAGVIGGRTSGSDPHAVRTGTRSGTTLLRSKELRRGKWTKPEEEYAAATIKYFCGGLLNLQFGTLLRGFLAQQLHCHPMRISKKLLPGTTFCGVEITRKLGRRAYSPRWCDSPEATQQKLDAEGDLSILRSKFIVSIEEEIEGGEEVGCEEIHDTAKEKRISETLERHRKSRSVSPTKNEDLSRRLLSSPAAGQQQHSVGHKRSRDEWTAEQPQQRHLRHDSFEYTSSSSSRQEQALHTLTRPPHAWLHHQQPPSMKSVGSSFPSVHPATAAGSPSSSPSSERHGSSKAVAPRFHCYYSEPRGIYGARLVLPTLRESLERASTFFE